MFINKLMRFRSWIVFLVMALLVTLIMLTIYAAVQQNYRNYANDPQVDASEQVANSINRGAPPEEVIGKNPVDIKAKTTPFGMMFDKDGKVTTSTARIGDQSPTPPTGVFEKARKTGSNRFTWEPEKGVRIAAVIKKLDDDKGFILVGKNMREVENRIKDLCTMVGIAWIIGLILSALLSWLLTTKRFNNTMLIEETVLIENVTPPENSI